MSKEKTELEKLVDSLYYYETVLNNIYHSEDRGYKITLKHDEKIKQGKKYKKLTELAIKWLQRKIDPYKLLRANYELRKGEFYFERMGHTEKTVRLYYEWLKSANQEKNNKDTDDDIMKEVITSKFFIIKYCKRRKITPLQYFSGYKTKLMPDIFKHIKQRNISYYILATNEHFIRFCKEQKAFKVSEILDKRKYANMRKEILSNETVKNFIDTLLDEINEEIKSI